MKQPAAILLCLTLSICAVTGIPVYAGAFEDGVGYYYLKDYKKAHDLWLPLAESGDAMSQVLVGSLYAFGQGVEKNDTEAVSWYRKAAEQDNPQGQFNLAVMYEYGWGVDKNLDEAYQWYEKAALHGRKDAQEKLKTLNTRDNTTIATTSDKAQETPQPVELDAYPSDDFYSTSEEDDLEIPGHTASLTQPAEPGRSARPDSPKESSKSPDTQDPKVQSSVDNDPFSDGPEYNRNPPTNIFDFFGTMLGDLISIGVKAHENSVDENANKKKSDEFPSDDF